jgi:hypothetical protein
VEKLRRLEDAEGVPAGERLIGGAKVRGFRVKKHNEEMTFWVNPETGFPVLIESSTLIDGKEMRGTLSDFVINPELDDALFRTDPPPGYTLRKAETDVFGDIDPGNFLNVEDAVVRLLRLYAEKSGGALPARIDDPKMFEKFLPEELKKKPAGAIPDPERFRIAMTWTRFMMAARELKDGYGYKADGVRLGDADTIVFWFKPRGAIRYRAVYGDLHAADVDAAQLPEAPKK